MSMTSEILFNMPGTAHILGGCTMGCSREEGVVDDRCRVFGYRNMYICDGSVLSANLGVNPSLTITAVAERAMSYVADAAVTDWNSAPARCQEKSGNVATFRHVRALSHPLRGAVHSCAWCRLARR